MASYRLQLQGGVNHETTGKRPYLVRINRVLHVVNIHNRLCETDTGRLRQVRLAYESGGK